MLLSRLSILPFGLALLIWSLPLPRVWATENITLNRPTPIYRGPTASSEMLAKYPAGTSLEVESESKGWFLVRFARPFKGANFGWLQALPEREAPVESDRKKFEAATELAYGLSDAFNLGLGVSAGVRPLDKVTPLLFRGRFDYFLGSTLTPANPLSVPTRSGAWLLTAEGGYDFPYRSEYLLRPYIGLGIAATSATNFVLSGGAAVLKTTGNWYYGADARLSLVDGSMILIATGTYGFYF